jgi:hypothetical protein
MLSMHAFCVADYTQVKWFHVTGCVWQQIQQSYMLHRWEWNTDLVLQEHSSSGKPFFFQQRPAMP